MGSKARTIRIAAASALALGALSLVPASASASFHLMKISAVYGGSLAISFNDAFVELQMHETGQNLVNGKQLRFYDGSGNLEATFTFSSNAVNGDSQRTIVVGDSSVTGGTDFEDPLMHGYVAGSGAVCFVDPPSTGIDCVAWGTFSGALPSPVGMPAAVSPFEATSLTRLITPNCPTLLEGADDTDNSAVDFTGATPSPRRNTVTPTETLCTPPPGGGGGGGGASDTTPPDTTITGGPKKKEKKGKATFSFSSTEPGSTFECKLDNGAFQGCTTPRDVQVKKGKHTFAVRAVDAAGNVDSSPATQDWTVKKKKKK